RGDHGCVRGHLARRQHRDRGHPRTGHRRARAPRRAHAGREDRERPREPEPAHRAGPAAGDDERGGAGMNLRESIGIALSGIRANKLRSFLTLLGIIIGVASVIAVVSFVEGLNRFVTQKLLNAGANVFVVDKWGFITSQEAFDEANKNPDVTLADADALRSGVQHAAMVVAEAGSAAATRYRNKDMKGVPGNGAGPGDYGVDDLPLEHGRHLSELDDAERRPVVVLGPEVVEELFGSIDAVGRSVRIERYEFEVVGVTQAKGKIFGQSQDRFAIVPIQTFQKYWQE